MKDFEEYIKEEKKRDDDFWRNSAFRLNSVESIGTWYEMGGRFKFYSSTDFKEIKSSLYHDIYEKYRLDDRFRLVPLPSFKTSSDSQILIVQDFNLYSLEDFDSLVNQKFSEGKKMCYLYTIYPHFNSKENKITHHTIRLTFE
jgi:hypothetical protein